MATRFRYAVAAAALLGGAACNDFLDVKPVSELPKEQAITGPTSARAAVLGIYDALQDGDYYGGDFVLLTDVSSDDVAWTGTFTTYADAEDDNLRADNGAVESMYNAMYTGIARANFAIASLPSVAGMSDAEKQQLLGEAYFLRALFYHDAVRLWGGMQPTDLGVPLVLTPISNPSSAAPVLRSTVAQVYTQILSDLTQAEARLGNGNRPNRASRVAARALRARVELYQRNWAQAEALATELINSPLFELSPSHEAQFTEEGSPTKEDIFKVSFTAVDYSNIGYYYLGRYETAPDPALMRLVSPGFNPSNPVATWAPNEERLDWDVFIEPTDKIQMGYKFPTTAGAEDFPVLRLAEMYLIRAEARAHIGGASLPLAIADVNVIRRRAGADTLVFGVDATTQQEVLNVVEREWRLEFAMEGHRWFVLRRFGTMAAYLTSQGADLRQERYPIPQSEINVVPGLQQNPGY
ncbi:MAG TPA: RagB/SusD family nutrient uptake outer membrane protein [Gemmatimonadaceae bacterium]|nr:RagB/SusD family nutrient uptake outer membrane protein [Gemmatimonadaceae bacterium]